MAPLGENWIGFFISEPGKPLGLKCDRDLGALDQDSKESRKRVI